MEKAEFGKNINKSLPKCWLTCCHCFPTSPCTYISIRSRGRGRGPRVVAAQRAGPEDVAGREPDGEVHEGLGGDALEGLPEGREPELVLEWVHAPVVREHVQPRPGAPAVSSRGGPMFGPLPRIEDRSRVYQHHIFKQIFIFQHYWLFYFYDIISIR